jgi:hypothetical protein
MQHNPPANAIREGNRPIYFFLVTFAAAVGALQLRDGRGPNFCAADRRASAVWPIFCRLGNAVPDIGGRLANRLLRRTSEWPDHSTRQVQMALRFLLTAFGPD